MVDEPVAAEHVLQEVAKRVSIRETHPNRFRSLITIAVFECLAAWSYFARVPTFNPVPRQVVGTVFGVLGVGLFVSLTMYRRLVLVNLFTGLSVFVLFAWGSLNLKQGLENKASYILPLSFGAIAVLLIWQMLEPWLNPITATGNGNGNGKRKREP